MKNCSQNSDESVYDHGVSVRDHVFDLISHLEGNELKNKWILPSWFIQNKNNLLKFLLPKEIINEYTLFHDCSKPYCKIIDENGKQHFPNHAQSSYELWIKIGGNKTAANLMKMDMDIHQLKNEGVDEFSSRKEAITLLIAGLAEITANSKMFGGFESQSFKIKYKNIERRGKVICKKLFNMEK